MIIDRLRDSASRRFAQVWEPIVFGMRTRGAEDGYVCRDILGSKMYLDVSDPGICRELILHGIREEWGTEVMRELLRPGQTIVDIGANIGYYALFEAAKVGPTGKVYAIEPVPNNFELLCRNVKANGYQNIETYKFAVGGEAGRAQMHVSHLRNWHSMTDVHATGQVIDVEVVTLDAFLADKAAPAIVRMDVEGFELEILKGMTRTMAAARELTLFIEIHPHIMGAAQTRAMLELLRTHGYDIARMASRNQEERYSIETLLRDEPAVSGKRGGYLVFFSKR